MNDRRPKIQLCLAFPEEERSETPRASGEGTESFAATRSSEHPASPEHFCSGRLTNRIAVYGPVRTVMCSSYHTSAEKQKLLEYEF